MTKDIDKDELKKKPKFKIMAFSITFFLAISLIFFLVLDSKKSMRDDKLELSIAGVSKIIEEHSIRLQALEKKSVEAYQESWRLNIDEEISTIHSTINKIEKKLSGKLNNQSDDKSLNQDNQQMMLLRLLIISAEKSLVINKDVKRSLQDLKNALSIAEKIKPNSKTFSLPISKLIDDIENFYDGNYFILKSSIERLLITKPLISTKVDFLPPKQTPAEEKNKYQSGQDLSKWFLDSLSSIISVNDNLEEIESFTQKKLSPLYHMMLLAEKNMLRNLFLINDIKGVKLSIDNLFELQEQYLINSNELNLALERISTLVERHELKVPPDFSKLIMLTYDAKIGMKK